MQIRILCGVDHEDLDQLSHVSKSIREAVSVTKFAHFISLIAHRFSRFDSSREFKVRIEIDFGFDSVKNLQTLIAKQWHFAYSTPRKVRAFRSAVDFDRPEDDEIEAPSAPKQSRPIKSRLFGKKLDGISVNLFD